MIEVSLIEEVRARAALEAVIGRVVKLKRRGAEFAGLCPFHHEKTPSFTVVPRKGFYKCFGCGVHGDAIDFVMQHEGLAFPDAVRRLAEDCGIVPPPPGQKARQPAPVVSRETEAEREASIAQRIETARRIWSNAIRADGDTPVERYLRARGIFLPPPRSLRFADQLAYWHRYDDEKRARMIGRWPAMVAAVQGHQGPVTAVQVTWLSNESGSWGKARIACPRSGARLPARRSFGPVWGGAVRLAPPASHVLLAEGTETALSVMSALCHPAAVDRLPSDGRGANPAGGRNAGLCFWAALSLDNIAGWWVGDGGPHPTRRNPRTGAPLLLPSPEPDMARPGVILPGIVRVVTILEDNDNADPVAAGLRYDCAALRFHRLGLEVRRVRPPAGMDFNDMLLRGAA